MLTSTDRHPFRFEALSKAHRKLLPDTFGNSPNVMGRMADIVTSASVTDNPFATNGCLWSPTFENGFLYQAEPSNLKSLGNYDGIGLDASKSSSLYKNVSKIGIRSVYALMIIKV